MFDDELVCTCCGEIQTEDNIDELCRYWGNRETHAWGDHFDGGDEELEE